MMEVDEEALMKTFLRVAAAMSTTVVLSLKSLFTKSGHCTVTDNKLHSWEDKSVSCLKLFLTFSTCFLMHSCCHSFAVAV